VLLCYDGSPSAKHAISVARETLGHESVTLLHVWEPPLAILSDSFSTAEVANAPTEELDRAALERAQQIAQEGCELARQLGLAVQARIERDGGDLARKVLEIADELDSALIVIGTRGTTAVQPALLGSVSGAVIRHSGRPVLVVPTPDRA